MVVWLFICVPLREGKEDEDGTIHFTCVQFPTFANDLCVWKWGGCGPTNGAVFVMSYSVLKEDRDRKIGGEHKGGALEWSVMGYLKDFGGI